MVKTKLDKSQCARLFNSTVLPAMLYASKRWVTSKKEHREIRKDSCGEYRYVGTSKGEVIQQRSEVMDAITE